MFLNFFGHHDILLTTLDERLAVFIIGQLMAPLDRLDDHD